MKWTTEQRYAIKFYSKLKKSIADTNQMIQEAYGDSALPYRQVFRWLKSCLNMAGKRWWMTHALDGRQPAKSDENVSLVSY